MIIMISYILWAEEWELGSYPLSLDGRGLG